MFFHHLNSDEFEEMRKADAAAVIPDFSDDMLKQCLAMIHGAPKGKTEDERRRLLLKWTQSTRAQRVTMFMTKTEMQTYAQENNIHNQIKWTTSSKRKVDDIRRALAAVIGRLESLKRMSRVVLMDTLLSS